MRPRIFFSRQIGSSLAAAAIVSTVLLGGCGNNQSTVPPSTESPQMGQGNAAAPVDTTKKKLKFEQLTLNSPVKHITKNGIAFLSFSYIDTDSSAANCVMPEAMAQGEYTNADWVATFSVYKLPGAVKVNVPNKNRKPGEINDFPFIAPKPHTAPGAPPPEKKPSQPITMPTMPSMPQPSAPSGSPAPAGPGGPMNPMGPRGGMPATPMPTMPGGK